MKRHHPFWIAGCIFLFGCAHAPVNNEGKVGTNVKIQEDKLENGLKILVLEDHSAPVVAVQVWYRVGSRNEHIGIRGLAHLVEHMLFKGSENVGPEDHARIIDAVGGQENAFTSEDTTAYHDTVPSDRLSLAMELEAERMYKAKLDETHFFKEREVVKEEIRMSLQNNPIGALFDKFRTVAYSVHPYNWTPGGTLEDLDQMTLTQLKAFYKTYYAPNNAVLIVTGDTNLGAVRDLATKFFGPIPSQAVPPAVTSVEPEQKSFRREDMRFPTQLPIVIAGYKTPEAMNQDMAALEVVQRILGDGKSSRLHQAMVRKTQLAVFAEAWNQRMYDPGLFMLIAGFTPDKQSKEVEDTLIGEVDRLGKEGPTAEELSKAKNKLTAEYVFKLVSIENLGFEIGDAELVERDYRHFLEGAAPYESVTAKDVERVIKKYLNRDRLTVSVLLPPREDETVEKSAPTTVEQANRDTASWPTAERFLKPGMPSSDPIALPPITRKTLSNGLKVMVVERHEQPVVYFSMVLPGGTFVEPKGKAGLSDLLCEMLTQGTNHRSADQIATEVDGLGGTLSASAAVEGLYVSGRFLKRDFDKGLDLFSDVVLHPTFSADELEKARPQKEGSVRMVKDQPIPMAIENLRYLIFGYDHPRGRPASLETVKAIKAADLVAAYQSAFQPQVSLLAVTGDVDSEKVIAALEKAFSSWKKTGEGIQYSADPSEVKGRLVRLVDKPDLTQSTVAVGNLAIQRKDPDYFPLVLGNYSLGGGGFSSRLMKNIRSKGGKTYGVGSNFSAGRTRGAFVIYSFTRNSETGNILKMVLDEIEAILKDGVTEEELLAAKNNLSGGYPLALQTPDGLADELIMAEFFGQGEDWVRSFRSRINAPTLADVKSALRRHLDVKNLAMVVVGKASEIIDQLKTFGTPKQLEYLDPVPDEERH
jgi:zinc protease